MARNALHFICIKLLEALNGFFVLIRMIACAIKMCIVLFEQTRRQ